MDILIVDKNWAEVPVFDSLPRDILVSLCQKMDAEVHFDVPATDTEDLLVIFEPAACLSVDTLREFTAENEPTALKMGEVVVATYFPKGTAADRKNAPLSSGMFRPFYVPAEESFLVSDAYNACICQDILKNRVNQALLESGVYISDAATAYISPTAVVEPGAIVLPNCQIYGNTLIKSGAKIGPNTVVRDSIIGQNSKINASQVYESTVGDGVTVGPFAYLRPQTVLEDNVKIGDFVEIKKSRIGEGAKVSHFAYIGDADIGKRVNYSCGAITVNYDGKNKFKTIVGDDSFIGCNVNLVAPVEIGKGAFVAAGSTVTDNVPPDALAIARERQVTKADWAKNRKEQGKL